MTSAPTVNWTEIRTEFPALANWTYLNTATYGQTPKRAAAAMARHLARRDEFACSDFLAWFDDVDAIRQSCARLINCQADDIAFVHSASAALSWLMMGLDWRPGDEVLTLTGEFPNNTYASPLIRSLGVDFRQVEWEQFYAAVSPQTRVVLLSTLNYATGFRPPIEEISQFLSKRNILLYLDGTQGVGALRFDAASVRPAMLAVDAYKWMLTPNGGGFVYISPDLRSRLSPSVIGWRSDRDWRNVNNLNHGDPVFGDAAEKFEGGMVVFPSLYAMGDVVDWMLEIGTATIESRVLELAGYLRAKLTSMGAEVSAAGSPIVTAKFENRDAAGLAQQLREKRIIASARHGRLRVSTHFYNNEADIDTLARALA